jgi:hypothetical protein
MGDTTHWPVHVHPALWPVIWPSSNQGSKNIKHIKHYLTLFNIFQKFPKHPVTLWYSLCSLSCPVLLNGIQEADGMAHIAARSLGEAMLCWESAIYQNLPTSWQSGLLTFWISRFGVFFQEWNQDVGNLSESIRIYQNLSVDLQFLLTDPGRQDRQDGRQHRQPSQGPPWTEQGSRLVQEGLAHLPAKGDRYRDEMRWTSWMSPDFICSRQTSAWTQHVNFEAASTHPTLKKRPSKIGSQLETRETSTQDY